VLSHLDSALSAYRHSLDCLTLEGGTDRLWRNVGNYNSLEKFAICWENVWLIVYQLEVAIFSPQIWYFYQNVLLNRAPVPEIAFVVTLLGVDRRLIIVRFPLEAKKRL